MRSNRNPMALRNFSLCSRISYRAHEIDEPVIWWPSGGFLKQVADEPEFRFDKLGQGNDFGVLPFVLQVYGHAVWCFDGEIRVVVKPATEVDAHSFIGLKGFIRMEAPEKDGFATSFTKGYGFSCGDPTRATVCVERGGFDVGFDCVVEDVGWLFP
jgi:hypothetical protein